MKINRLFPVLIFVLALVFLMGCSPATMVHSLDRAEDAIENRVDAAEDTAQQFVEDTLSNTAPVQNPSALTAEEAKSIALSHAGFAADQVRHLHAQFDHDRIDHYDVEFHRDGWEYDYEIDAATGEILSWDRDD